MSILPISLKILLLRLAGGLLCLIGMGVGYYWFYYLEPLRNCYDPAWGRSHSYSAEWEECQKCIHRSGWYHDAIVGRCGDKQWGEWIVAHIKPGDDISSCRAGHKASALRMLTNQDAGDSADAWIAWWEENKLKSQEEWIRDGFRKKELEISAPLSKSSVAALLKIIACKSEKEEECGAPQHLQYNAFRWLRDCDFDPQTFSVADLRTEDADEVLQGLLRFTRLSGEYPKQYGVGVLNLGEPPRISSSEPVMSTRRFTIMMNLIIFVPFCIGLVLLWISFRIRKRTPAQAQRAVL